MIIMWQVSTSLYTMRRRPSPRPPPRRRRAVSLSTGSIGSLLLCLTCPSVGAFAPLTIGGSHGNHGSTESMRIRQGSWTETVPCPYSSPTLRIDQRSAERAFMSSSQGGAASSSPPLQAMTPGTPLEVWLQGRLAFAAFEGPNPGKASIRVRMAFEGEKQEKDGAAASITALDVGQVTGVWESCRVDSWTETQEEAGRILRDMTSKALDLDHFWSLAMKPWKRGKIPTTSHHLAGYLFHKRHYEMLAPLGREGEISVSAAERYAAAVLLASETFRFKRSVPTRVAGQEEGADDGGMVRLRGAGYRPLDASVVHSREVLSFANAVRRTEEARRLVAAVDGGAAAAGPGGAGGGVAKLFWDAVHWRMLHHLEVMALGAGVEGLSSDAQNVLKLLGEEASPQGARKILLRAGYWTSEKDRASRQGDTEEEDGEEEGGGGGGGGGGIKQHGFRGTAEPWPEEALEVAKDAWARSQKRREALRSVSDTGVREDYRDAPFLAYCVDPAGSEFADDAVSFDPSTGELLIHIADVQSMLLDYPELEKIAWRRGEAFYLPDGPLHLLPPTALRAASLSDQHPNECVTVAVKINGKGVVESCRIFLSVIPPVTRILYEDVNALMEDAPEDSPPYMQRQVKELRVLLELASRRRSYTQREFSNSKALAGVVRNSEGNLEGRAFQRTPAHLMVDEFLALYSEACRRFCEGHGVAIPLAAGSSRARFDALRFGTGPLRRYADVIAQRQVSAIIADRPPLTKADVREGMLWVNKQRVASQKLRTSSRQRVLLETFATFCSTKARASKSDRAVVRAVATGIGTEVTIPDAGGILSYVRVAAGQSRVHLEEGEVVDVEVIRVDPLQNDVELVFAATQGHDRQKPQDKSAERARRRKKRQLE